MDQPIDLTRKLAPYCAWFRLTRSWLLLQIAIFAVCLTTAIFIACDKMIFIGGDYLLIATWLIFPALLFLLIHFIFMPIREAYVSYLVDKNAGTRNLVSSGLAVQQQQDEVSAVVSTRADQALKTAHPYRLMPFSFNWAGRYSYIPALLLLAACLAPRMDLLKRKQKQQEQQQEAEIIKKGALTLSTTFREIKKAEDLTSTESNQVIKDFSLLAKELKGTSKQDALLKLGEFENRYRKEFSEQRDFEKAAKALTQAPDMTDLSKENQDLIKKLNNNLSKGDFKNAADAMRELAKQLQKEDLTPAERQALAREMGKVAKQLQDATGNKELADLLQQIQSSPQDLDKILQQCKQASDQMNQMARMCEQGEDLKAMQDGLNDAKQAMLGDSFNDFNQAEIEQYMEEQACLGGLGQGQGQGQGDGKGDGTGGEGQGRGGSPLENMTDTAFKNERSNSKINKGRILHQIFVTGVPEKGEASVEYTQVIKAARQHAAGSLARDKIPREYEDMVKTYFDSLDVKENDSSASGDSE